MRPFLIQPAESISRESLIDAIICEEVKQNGKRLFHKGHRITSDDIAPLQQLDRSLHALWLDADDVHEDEAGHRLAAALLSDGLVQRRPVQSRVNIAAAVKGLLRVNQEALLQLNSIPDVAIFTLLDRQTVIPGKVVAGVKITPVATSQSNLQTAESIAQKEPVLQLKPFLPLQVGVITTEWMDEKTQERFRQNVLRKIAWYGASVIRFIDLQHEPELVAQGINQLNNEGADLILTGGGNTIDPLDATLLALRATGASMVKFGAPAHPGSMFWLAYRGSTPIFNLASCSMYSKATVADLVLPWIMAGEKVRGEEIAALGYGGLLDRDMQFRFPPYEQSEAVEPDLE